VLVPLGVLVPNTLGSGHPVLVDPRNTCSHLWNEHGVGVG
jgi:hypothetical protein